MLRRFLIAGLSAGALCAPAAADISISQEAGMWTIAADGESLDQVVAQLSEEAGFRLTGGDRLAAGPGLNGSIEGDLRSVAERLLRGRDYALVFGETPETADQLQRIVILSGRVGDMPLTSEARPSIPDTRPVQPLTEDEAERVSALLARQIQPLIDAEEGGETTLAANSASGASTPSAQAPADPDMSTDDLDAETQAALAAATQQARADLQALVNALQEHEQNGGAPD